MPPSPGRPVLKGTLAFPPAGGREKDWSFCIYQGQGYCCPRSKCSQVGMLLVHTLSLPVQRASGLPGCVSIHKCLSLHLDQGLWVPTDPEQMGNLGLEDGSAQPRAWPRAVAQICLLSEWWINNTFLSEHGLMLANWGFFSRVMTDY